MVRGKGTCVAVSLLWVVVGAACLPPTPDDAGVDRLDAGPGSADAATGAVTDAGRRDAGVDDGGATDAASFDGGARDAGRRDGGPRDGGGPTKDAGPPGDAGASFDGGAVQDAGAADAGGPDGGAPADGGTADAGGPGVCDDAPLDLETVDAGFAVAQVSLPFVEAGISIATAERYCVSFVVEEAGELTLETGNSVPCSSDEDTVLTLYGHRATDDGDELASDDDTVGLGTCSRVVGPVAAGRYVACVRSWNPSEALEDVTLSGEMKSTWACGDGALDPNEECESADDGCLSCCRFADGVRENEAAGNDDGDGAGVRTLVEDRVGRGGLDGNDTEDWWNVWLPADPGPGALIVEWTDPDPTAAGCARAEEVQVSLGKLPSDPLDTVEVSGSCGGVIALALPDGVQAGGRSFLARVFGASVAPYELRARYVTGICGDGFIEPWEGCDPAVPAWEGVCDARCVPIPPPNDACVDAEDLTAQLSTDGSVLSLVATTLPASDATTVGCGFGGPDLRDVHYSFTAPADGRVRLELFADGWLGRTDILSADCASVLSCGGVGGVEEINVAAGETYVVVVDADGDEYDAGPFALYLSYLVPPANDACDESAPVAVPEDGSPVLVVGDTRAATDDAAASGCVHSPSYSHRDTFHSFTTPAPGDVFVDVVSRWETLLHVRAGCAGGELGCAEAPARVVVPAQAGGDLTAVVDAWGFSRGPYALTVRYGTGPLVVPGGDTCGAAVAVGAGGALGDTLDGASPQLDPELLGDCTGSSATGPDVVYAVDVGPGQILYARLAPSVADAALYVLADCGGSGASCVAGSDRPGAGAVEEIEIVNPTELSQRYYLVVDEYVSTFGTPSAGAYELQWFVRP